MSSDNLEHQLKETKNMIRLLQEELKDTNQGTIALTLELEKSKEKLSYINEKLEQKVDERTRELRTAQENLIQAEKLAVVGKFAGSIGHELRNPLGVISNSIFYLNMKLKNSDDKIRKHLEIIDKEIQRSNKIITDLLDFAKMKQPILEKREINFLIKEILNNIRIPTNIGINLNLNTNLPSIFLDPLMIQQAFQNIISNAIDAMPKGGFLEIKSLYEKNTIKILFKDTGVGISKENLQKIFEPLFSTKVKGVGLGLPIVKEIIEAHNGHIEFNSEVGIGTTFTVILPIKGE